LLFLIVCILSSAKVPIAILAFRSVDGSWKNHTRNSFKKNCRANLRSHKLIGVTLVRPFNLIFGGCQLFRFDMPKEISKIFIVLTPLWSNIIIFQSLNDIFVCCSPIWFLACLVWICMVIIWKKLVQLIKMLAFCSI